MLRPSAWPCCGRFGRASPDSFHQLLYLGFLLLRRLIRQGALEFDLCSLLFSSLKKSHGQVIAKSGVLGLLPVNRIECLNGAVMHVLSQIYATERVLVIGQIRSLLESALSQAESFIEIVARFLENKG